MDRPELIAILKKNLADVSGMKISNITDESRFVSDLNLESIDVVDLNFLLDQSLPCRVDLLELFRLSQLRSENDFYDPSVKEVADFLEKNLNKKV